MLIYPSPHFCNCWHIALFVLLHVYQFTLSLIHFECVTDISIHHSKHSSLAGTGVWWIEFGVKGQSISSPLDKTRRKSFTRQLFLTNLATIFLI